MHIKKLFIMGFVVILVLCFMVSCTDGKANSKKDTAQVNYLDLEKVSDVTSGVFRLVDDDYGIVIYIVDTYKLATGPSVSGVRMGKIKVQPVSGTTKLTKRPKVYRFVDTEMGTVSYIVDTCNLASAPSIETFSLYAEK